jgi:hypothetical protein
LPRSFAQQHSATASQEAHLSEAHLSEARLSNAPVPRQWENRLLATLPPETQSLLDPALKEVFAAQGTVFLESGSPIDHVFFPLSRHDFASRCH